MYRKLFPIIDYFLCVASRAGNRKSPPVFVFTSADGLWGFLRILFFVRDLFRLPAVRQDWPQSAPPGLSLGFCVLGAAVYLIHRGCDDKPFDAVLCKDVVVAAAESFSNAAVRPSSATALS